MRSCFVPHNLPFSGAMSGPKSVYPADLGHAQYANMKENRDLPGSLDEACTAHALRSGCCRCYTIWLLLTDASKHDAVSHKPVENGSLKRANSQTASLSLGTRYKSTVPESRRDD